MLNGLPFFASGEIVHGFGRGSKELGIPTANYELEIVKSLPSVIQTGVYYGWANVDNGEVYKMVMSIGTNPYYENKEKSMETHIIHEFNRDLYGQLLKVCIVGYLRPELNFNSLDELKAAINNDIEQAKHLLNVNDEVQKLKESTFFKDNTTHISCNTATSSEDESPARDETRS